MSNMRGVFLAEQNNQDNPMFLREVYPTVLGEPGANQEDGSSVAQIARNFASGYQTATNAISMSQIPNVLSGGVMIAKFFSISYKELNRNPKLSQKIISDEMHKKIIIPMTVVLAGLIFLQARNSSRRQNNKLADSACFMLSMFTFMLLNNKFKSVEISTNPMKVMDEFFGFYGLFKASKEAQTVVRKVFSEPRRNP